MRDYGEAARAERLRRIFEAREKERRAARAALRRRREARKRRRDE